MTISAPIRITLAPDPAWPDVSVVMIDGKASPLRIGVMRGVAEIGVADPGGDVDWVPVSIETRDPAACLIHSIATALRQHWGLP